jgi:Double-GTPase 1/Translation initiation factor IF-2, N-terminal region
VRVYQLASEMSVDVAALIAVLQARGIDVSNEASKVEGEDLRRVFVHRLAIADECRNLPKEWYAARFGAIEPDPLPFNQGSSAVALPALDGEVEIEDEQPEPPAAPESQPDVDSLAGEGGESVEDWLKRMEAGENVVGGETAVALAPVEVAAPPERIEETLPAVPETAPPVPAVRAPEPDEGEWVEAIAGARRPILLWGPPASGKTNFLASLLAKQADDPVDPYEWRIMTIGWRTGDYLAEILASSKEGRKPRATMHTAAPYRFEISKVRKERKLLGVLPQDESVKLIADLFVLDPMGELFTRGDLVTSRAGARFLALLEKAGGILLLIDPTSSTNGHDTGELDRLERDRMYWTMLVSNLSAMIEWLKQQSPAVRKACLDEENRLTIPVAVCLTKMDRHPEQLNRPKDFLREQLGAVHGIIERSFCDYRVYACSAYGSGALHDPERGEQFDGRFRPWQVLEPVKWIIESNSAAARGGLRGKLGL